MDAKRVFKLPQASALFTAVLLAGIAGITGYAVFLYRGVEYAQSPAGTSNTAQQEQSLSGSVVSQPQNQREADFAASDGYRLKATVWVSPDADAPAIILVHQYGSNRHDFDAFVPALLSEGYTVLAYDIRGFGESRDGPANINDFPKDVVGAVRFLASQKAPPSRIGIIGASVGANVAFVASGSVPDIAAAVALSPSNTGPRGVLMGNDIQGFHPNSILIASDEREKSDADFMFNLTRDPKEEKTYPGFGHGVSLLQSADARNDILAFLRARLTP